MVTGGDKQKASVGFKAFGLRTEGSCMDLLDGCALQRGRGKLCVCVWALSVCLGVCRCAWIVPESETRTLQKVRQMHHQGVSKQIPFNRIRTFLTPSN